MASECEHKEMDSKVDQLNELEKLESQMEKMEKHLELVEVGASLNLSSESTTIVTTEPQSKARSESGDSLQVSSDHPAEQEQLDTSKYLKPKEGFFDEFIVLLREQDTQQKLIAIASFLVELYRVLVSSLLILFVPQQCGDHICTYSENMESPHHLYSTGLVVNFITLGAFFTLYLIEIQRENMLINYLDVSKSKPSDNESVGEALKQLSPVRFRRIHMINRLYKLFGRVAFLLFILNTILSGLVVYEYGAGNQTTSTYVTNVMFMATKMIQIYGTLTAEKNVFYSAYLSEKVQYNDVDPQKVETMLSMLHIDPSSSPSSSKEIIV
jgi:hypothetical protein